MIFDEMHTFRAMVIGKKMMDYVKKKNGSDEEAQKAFLLGYLHDIGYLFDGDDETHARVGGKFLKAAGYSYWKDALYHGKPSNYHSEELLLLELADMTTSDDGRHVRLDEVAKSTRKIYGKNSSEYRDLMKRITDIQYTFPAEDAMPITDFFNGLAGGKYREVKGMDTNILGTFFDVEDAAVGDFGDDDTAADFLEQEISREGGCSNPQPSLERYENLRTSCHHSDNRESVS